MVAGRLGQGGDNHVRLACTFAGPPQEREGTGRAVEKVRARRGRPKYCRCCIASRLPRGLWRSAGFVFRAFILDVHSYNRHWYVSITPHETTCTEPQPHTHKPGAIMPLSGRRPAPR